MLIQGGTISSGRFSTCSVAGAYWISSMISLRNTTLPGVFAMLTPTSKACASDWRIFSSPPAGLDVLGQHLHAAHEVLAVLLQGLAQQFRVGDDEIGGGEGAGDLLDVEARLLAGVRIEILGLVDHRFRPARADQIGLLDEVEHRMVRPVGIGEAGIALVRLDDGLRLLAAGALQHRAPQIEEVAGDRGLRLDDLAGIADPALGDAAERLDHLAGFLGLAGLGLAALDRLEIGGGHLAVFLDQPAHVLGELVEIGHRDLGRARAVFRLLVRRPVHEASLPLRLLCG